MSAQLTFHKAILGGQDAHVFVPKFTDEDFAMMEEIERKMLEEEMDPDLEALLYEDEHEKMLEDLAELLEEDLDGTILSGPPPQLSHMPIGCCPTVFWHKARYPEFLHSNPQVPVRMVMDKGGYWIGSIAGQKANVFISKDLAPSGNLHSYYLMDLEYNPVGRNMWRATGVHPKLDSMAMLVAETSFVHPAVPGSYIMDSFPLSSEHTFDVPMPPHYIGAIIGKGGKNLDALLKKFCGSPYAVLPEVTITPLTDTSFRVSILAGEDCHWNMVDSATLISYMHC